MLFPGYGSHPWWDPSAGRWLPVARSAVAPDGQTYAYSSGDGLHLVVIAPTADTVLYRYPAGVEGAQVLAYLAAGVYFDVPSAIKSGAGGSYSNPVNQIGVRSLYSTTGSSTRILTPDNAGSFHGGALWSVQTLDAGETLVRTDLSSGQQTEWFTDPGRSMQFAGGRSFRPSRRMDVCKRPPGDLARHISEQGCQLRCPGLCGQCADLPT